MNTHCDVVIEGESVGFVKLIRPLTNLGYDGDSFIANCARASFNKSDFGDEYSELILTEEAAQEQAIQKQRDYKLIGYLMKHKHTSPFEMARFVFQIKAPMVVLWQTVRHRTAAHMSINSNSGRYSVMNDLYFPPAFYEQSSTNKQASASKLPQENHAQADEILRKLYQDSVYAYDRLLELGVSREQARFALPGFSIYYTWVINVSAHNLMHFLELRNAPDVQIETRAVAVAMETIFAQVMPVTYRYWCEQSNRNPVTTG